MAADALLQRTHALRSDFFTKDGELIARLAREGQKPQVMFVGCSDSRVVPEMLTGARPGELFVARNIANIIPPYGIGHHSIGAALEYAVSHLKIAHLVVCGHTDCGGLKALDGRLSRLDEPSLASWIEFARPAQTNVDARGAAPDRRHRAIVEQNIILQLEHAAGYPVVRRALKENRLELCGWLYDMHEPAVYAYNSKTQKFEPA